MKLRMVAMAAFAALTVGAAPAVAGQFESRVTIREAADGSNLHGRVISDKRRCRVHRDVALLWDAPGSPRDFIQVAGDFTNDRGRWVIPGPGGDVPPGRYYAKALRKGEDCRPATSEIIRVRPE